MPEESEEELARRLPGYSWSLMRNALQKLAPNGGEQIKDAEVEDLLRLGSGLPDACGLVRKAAAPVNGDDVRSTWPMRASGGGYSVRQVDDLLRRVAAELDAGRRAGPLISNAAFPRDWRTSSRYEGNAVDWFLEQFLAAPGQSDGAGMSWDPWRDLPVVNLITRPGPAGPGGAARRFLARLLAGQPRDEEIFHRGLR